MTNEEMASLKAAFGDFCTHEVRAKHCTCSQCSRCVISAAYNIVCQAKQEEADERFNPYADAVAKVSKLYDVGEENLTDDDVVKVNGIDCYVLRTDGDKALMITKDIYNQRFNNTNTGVEAEYNYATADIKTYMDDFYAKQLGSDPYILNTEVTYYFNDKFAGGDLSKYHADTLSQKVFALDAKEAREHKNKLGWNYEDKMDGRGYGFWVTAGYRGGSDYSGGFYVGYAGDLGSSIVASVGVGVRPAFWLDLK